MGLTTKYLIWRVIGNDLPPRHLSGGTLAATRFILEHEPDFADCGKRWLLNRIVEPDVERQLVELLEQHHAVYSKRAFDLQAYRRQSCRYDKLLTAIDINGARNLALREGRSIARYTLPLDGGCFFSRRGWQAMTQQIEDYEQCGEQRLQFAVPMMRLQSMEQALDDALVPEPLHEPQLVLRNDAVLEFSERQRYGFRDKVELLQRMGRQPGFLIRKDESEPAHVYTQNESGCPDAGYVLRLPSEDAAVRQRASRQFMLTREDAIDLFLDRLDAAAGLPSVAAWEVAADPEGEELRCLLRSVAADDEVDPLSDTLSPAIGSMMRITAAAGARLGSVADFGAFGGRAAPHLAAGVNDLGGSIDVIQLRWDAGPDSDRQRVGCLAIDGEASYDDVIVGLAGWGPRVIAGGLLVVTHVDDSRPRGGYFYYRDRLRGNPGFSLLYRAHGLVILRKT